MSLKTFFLYFFCFIGNLYFSRFTNLYNYFFPLSWPSLEPTVTTRLWAERPRAISSGYEAEKTTSQPPPRPHLPAPERGSAMGARYWLTPIPSHPTVPGSRTPLSTSQRTSMSSLLGQETNTGTTPSCSPAPTTERWREQDRPTLGIELITH